MDNWRRAEEVLLKLLGFYIHVLLWMVFLTPVMLAILVVSGLLYLLYGPVVSSVVGSLAGLGCFTVVILLAVKRPPTALGDKGGV